MSVTTVQSEFKLVRTVDISGGFTPDADWVATNDVAAAKASNFSVVVPSVGSNGDAELLIAFWDDLSTPIAAGNFTGSFEFLTTLEAPGIAPTLQELGANKSIAGGIVLALPGGFVGKTNLIVRAVTATNLPAAPTADIMAILLRVR